MPELLDRVAEVEAAAALLPLERSAVEPLGDEQLMELQRRLAAVDRRTAALAAMTAAEIGWRSRPDLGYAGLAQRTGARTPESLVQQLTGATGREASTLIRVGAVMHEAELQPPVRVASDGRPSLGPDGSSTAPVDATPAPETPWDGTGTAWLAPVGRAVARGSLPVDAADAIRHGLGTPNEDVPVARLTAAAETRVDEAAALNADQLLKRARAVRDEIDEAGVAERERQRHEHRSLRVFRRHDGMIRVDGVLAPESGGAEVLATFEAVTSPRRGGPRFVDELEQERAKRILDDSRTVEQLQADALVELLRLGVAADPGTIVGSRKPAVRVLVTAEDLEKRAGIGRLEGHTDAVSIGTVERNVCTAGILPIQFDDDGQCLNVGREQRLFTERQRVALAARDGGCRVAGCDRPPSWCEAHHLDEWERDHGETNVLDGILLCRHHHMLVHNNRWRVERRGADYFLIPPREQDPMRVPIAMPSKSAALSDLLRRKRTG
jgi:hypothetical protein